MLINYLKLSLRLLARNPFFTFINVAGLSVGFAVSYILWQYSQKELNSDRQWLDWERTYQFGIVANITDDGENFYTKIFSTNDPELTRQAVNLYDEVESYSFFFTQNTFNGEWDKFKYTSHGSDLFFIIDGAKQKEASVESKVVYGRSNLFPFFDIPLISGNLNSCLKLAGSVVLSETKAKKYFGNENAIGRTLLLNGKTPFTVTGIFRDLPKNTHFDFDIVLSAESLTGNISDLHNAWWGPRCYIRLRSNSNVTDLTERMNTDMKDIIRQVTWKDSHATRYGTLYLQNLSDVSFRGYYNDTFQTKSRSVIKAFQYAAFTILLMAWANYVNLTVSSNRKRIKEMTARKTVGATTKDFLTQYVLETVIVNFISILLALTIIQLIRPIMEVVFHFYIPPWSEFTVSSVLIILIGLALVILLTSIYPAIILINKSPKNPFGSAKVVNEKHRFVSALTVLQFTGALVLIVWIFAVYAQINLVLNADIGFNKEQTLVVDLPVNRSEHFESELHSFLTEISSLSGVSNFTVCQSIPGDKVRVDLMFLPQLTGTWIGAECNGGVDENFVPFFSIKLIAGRNFLSDHPADSSSVMLSAAMARRIGFNPPESAIGERLIVGTPLEIIGVFEDYKIRPLFDEVYSGFDGDHGLALASRNYRYSKATFLKPFKVAIHIDPNQVSQVIRVIKHQYNRQFPGEPFNWYFLDQVVSGQYQQHKYARNQILLFTFIAIGIACLGLLGMISNKVTMKIKEIGIRKVLGAQVYQIAQLLVNTTTKQFVVSVAIGIPLAYYLIQQYLERFTVKIQLQWWLFVLPVAILIAIMFFTISAVVWKAAKSNPVEALKYE